jgi:hypothetical protein
VLRDAALREILALPRANVYDDVAQNPGRGRARRVRRSCSRSSTTRSRSSRAFFATVTSPVARQLKVIAMLIEGRAQTGLRRQVFYANQWAYDTHGNRQPSNRYCSTISRAGSRRSTRR